MPPPGEELVTSWLPTAQATRLASAAYIPVMPRRAVHSPATTTTRSMPAVDLARALACLVIAVSAPGRPA